MLGVPPLKSTGGLLFADQQAGVGGIARYQPPGRVAGIGKLFGCAAKRCATVVANDGTTVIEPRSNRADGLLAAVANPSLVQCHSVGAAPTLPVIGAIVIDAGLLGFWLISINPSWVRIAADAYAERLLESSSLFLQDS